MSSWHLVYDSWEPESQPLREALCTLGNGKFATRGAAEEANAGGPHYPGTYLAGGYNRLVTEISGREIENEDLVNWPNWLCLNFRPRGGEWLNLQSVEVKGFRQNLDLKRGLLERRIHFEDAQGRETLLVSRRIVSMHDPHLGAIQWSLTPLNWNGKIEIRSALDGEVKNEGVERYKKLNSRHLKIIDAGPVGDEAVQLTVRTNQSHIVMAQTARTRVFIDGNLATPNRSTKIEGGLIHQTMELDCMAQEPVRIEKVVALHTSRDRAISEPALASRETLLRAPSFEEILKVHEAEWRGIWFRADVLLHGVEGEQMSVRLNIFHLLQTVSCHSIDLDVGMPSRGLHGEAYRGHIFWDELFVFPFLNLRMPDLTRSLLMYRSRRLARARILAGEQGYRGAMYPWQSGSDGREESQVVHLNPRSGRWLPDPTNLQRHVNTAIAYNIWHYYQITEDREFLSFYGAVMFLEIARFLASLTSYNQQRHRYDIRGVVGPDEYHTKYPDAEEPGIDNNAYTNVMVAWVMAHVRRLLDLLAPERRHELRERLGITDEELSLWDRLSREMFVPFHGDGIISQFEGYEKLEEFDWEGYGKKYDDIQRLDRILEAEDDTPNNYKAAKQADVLMLFYLLSSEQLKEIFDGLGYGFSPDLIPKNIAYYTARTSHGSTLSRVVHSWVLARSDREGSWRFFDDALKSDLRDIQGGTTPEGVHLGAMAGATDIIQRCYLGIQVHRDVLWLNPILPKELEALALRIHYRGHWVSLHVTGEKLRVKFEEGWFRTAKVGFRGEVHTFEPGASRVFDLRQTGRKK